MNEVTCPDPLNDILILFILTYNVLINSIV